MTFKHVLKEEFNFKLFEHEPGQVDAALFRKKKLAHHIT